MRVCVFCESCLQENLNCYGKAMRPFLHIWGKMVAKLMAYGSMTSHYFLYIIQKDIKMQLHCLNTPLL